MRVRDPAKPRASEPPKEAPAAPARPSSVSAAAAEAPAKTGAAAPASARDGARASAMGGKPPAKPGSTTRAATIAVPASAPRSLTSLAGLSLVELAAGAIHEGTLTAEVPLRSGRCTLPVGDGIHLTVPQGAVAKVRARIGPGPRLLGLRIDLSPRGLGARLGGLAALAGTRTVDAIEADAQGRLTLHGPLVGLLPSAMLPAIPTDLRSLTGPPRSRMPGFDARELLRALGGLLESAKVELVAKGPGRHVSTGTDGAEVLSSEGRSTLRLSAGVSREGNELRATADVALDARELGGSLNAKSSGAIDLRAMSYEGSAEAKLSAGAQAPLPLRLELGDQKAAATLGDVALIHEGGGITVRAGALTAGASAGALGQLRLAIGGAVDLRLTSEALVSGEVRIALQRGGALEVRARDVEATVQLAGCSASAEKIQCQLGPEARAHLRIAELGLAPEGLILRGAEGDFAVTVASGALHLGDARLALDPHQRGRLEGSVTLEPTQVHSDLRFDLATHTDFGALALTSRLTGEATVTLSSAGVRVTTEKTSA